MERRIDIIYKTLKTYCQDLEEENFNQLTLGATATEIADISGYSRSNVSRELKQLVGKNKVIRIGGRPVFFLTYDAPYLKKYEITNLSSNKFSTLAYFLDELAKLQIMTTDTGKGKEEKQRNHAFSDLIGSDKSMKTQVKQAIAAILYPPQGLNTLLVGETGVGKTTFANTMYRFALSNKKFEEKIPYILFNCADYSGNPQLLLSHLFGYAKGSFTGAEQNKDGLVTQADGGILFLDEIHRLPAEGQEMLFSLMDHGEYRRLGESVVTQKANVMIIAATTEEPTQAILKTFLRRIPNVIRIPSLKERSIEERLELIYLYFRSESKAINRRIQVSTDVVNFLLFYDCPHNLGQLINDVKLAIASAFSESLVNSKGLLQVELANLPKHHFDYFFILDKQRKQGLDWQGKSYIDFYPDHAPSSIEKLIVNFQQESAFYKKLEKNSKKYFKEGIDAEEIRKYVDEETMNYFGNREKNSITEENQAIEKPIYKIIPKQEYDFLDGLIKKVVNSQQMTLSEQAMIGLIMHLKNLINKVKGGKYNIQYKSDVKKGEALSYQIMAEKIVMEVEQYYKITVPEYEIGLIALFLNSLDMKKTEKKVGILVITHGNSSANDMANVANQLLKVNHARGLCMPLEGEVGRILKQAIELVKQLDEGKGVLLLIDMGSLSTFGDIITEETGVLTQTIHCVSTPFVLEATRLAVSSAYDIHEIYTAINESGKEYKMVRDETQALIEQGLVPLVKEKIVKLIEEMSSFIDVKKVSLLLEEVYHKILSRINQVHSDSLYIKFIFHTVSMLERIIQKNALIYYHFEEKIIEFEQIFTVVKEEFQLLEMTLNISIIRDELAYVAEIFYFSDMNFEIKNLYSVKG